jgi:hypothetical protein
MTEDSM